MDSLILGTTAVVVWVPEPARFAIHKFLVANSLSAQSAMKAGRGASGLIFASTRKFIENSQPLSKPIPQSCNMTCPAPALFALDFETTGLDPSLDQVLEVGLAGPRPFHALAADAIPSSAAAAAVHRISRQELQHGGIPGASAFAGLLAALGPAPVQILCHNASFERGFLEAWARRLGQALPEIQWTCTLDLARRLCPDRALSKRLEPLARLLGLRHGPLHRAPADAALTLRLHAALQAWQVVKQGLAGKAPLVYLAGPVRGDGSGECVRFNHDRMLLQARWAQAVLPEASLFVPHGNFAFLDESGDPTGQVRELALRSCLQVLSRCDALVLCAEEPSPGMLLERDLAVRMGLPVFQVPGWDPFLNDNADRIQGAA